MNRQPSEPNVVEEWWWCDFRNSVVSNFPTGHDSKFMLDCHKGHMVCENVADPKIGALISKLPQLMRAVEDVLRPYKQDTELSTINPELATLRDIYNQMTKGVQCDAAKRPQSNAEEGSSPPDEDGANSS